MKYYNLKQGKTNPNDGKWYQPKNMNEIDGFEFNMEHGLLTEITEEQSKHVDWGSGNYAQNDDGTFTFIVADWDSSG